MLFFHILDITMVFSLQLIQPKFCMQFLSHSFVSFELVLLDFLRYVMQRHLISCCIVYVLYIWILCTVYYLKFRWRVFMSKEKSDIWGSHSGDYRGRCLSFCGPTVRAPTVAAFYFFTSAVAVVSRIRLCAAAAFFGRRCQWFLCLGVLSLPLSPSLACVYRNERLGR
jgi:hypothetical protein